MGILVRAYREGFHGGRRYRVGAEFTVPSTTIESSWFEPVKAGEKLRPRPDLTQAQRAQAIKEARGKRKRILAEKAKAKLVEKPVRERPTALSEVTQQRTAIEQVAAPEVVTAPVPAVEGEADEKSDEPLASEVVTAPVPAVEGEADEKSDEPLA